MQKQRLKKQKELLMSAKLRYKYGGWNSNHPFFRFGNHDHIVDTINFDFGKHIQENLDCCKKNKHDLEMEELQYKMIRIEKLQKELASIAI